MFKESKGAKKNSISMNNSEEFFADFRKRCGTAENIDRCFANVDEQRVKKYTNKNKYLGGEINFRSRLFINFPQES